MNLNIARTRNCPFCAAYGLPEKVYWVRLQELVDLGVNSMKSLQPEDLLALYGGDLEVWTCFACCEWGLL